MPLRKAYRLRWQPKGLSDSLDGNNSFPGAMSILTNLIPDPSTPDSWVPRPGSVSKTTFGSFTTPGFISGFVIVGDIEYGMIASGRNAGKDEPYAYNISTSAFLTVTGITSASTPTSPATSGDWAPPILAQVGNRIMVCHPGFAGGAIKVGWFDVSNFTSSTLTGTTNSNTSITAMSSNPITAGWQPGMTITGTNIPANTTIISLTATTAIISQAATGSTAGVTFTVAGGTTASPQWASGDLNVNNLPSVPLGVAQFNGRAYYACGVNGVVFSDSLIPCNRTNASQALTTNDGIAVTAIAPLMLSSPFVGGIVQSLIAFQGVSKMQQISGDSATSNLSMNALSVATGTLSPLAIAPTTKGLAFISPDGLRVIGFSGEVSDAIGEGGTGVVNPFLYAQNPSRTCAAANSRVYRVSVKRGDVANNPVQEFWYDLARRTWSGPHNFPASIIQPWQSTFVMSASGINAALWQSDSVPSSTSTYTENGAQMTWSYQPVLLPDDQEMNMISVSEASVMIAISVATVTAQAIDDLGNTLDTVSLAQGAGPTLWDAALWDQAVWDGSPIAFRQRALQWTHPLVAKQLTVQLSGNSAASFRIGNLSLRYQRLGYQLEVA